ncbi:MAG: 16S rRNA (guanine(527)-N(7))-methyltransferase RsmG [Deltaproteobacteria bacterium]|nr:16S rRNA (guanine(527)-N(7))-methyltransferase RsmG [Deltaproteobacteria bacterium]
MQPTFDHFKQLFKRCGLDLSPSQYELFWLFHRELSEKGREMDLTRIRRFEDLVIKHYVDCALVPNFVQLASPVLDIGTGAGFPGIPIKILQPHLEMILAEGRAYRVLFLEHVCRVLALKDVRVYPHKISSVFPEAVNTVITRAFEAIPETLRRVGGFLKEGGKVVLMKGPACNDEIKAAAQEFSLEYQLIDDIAYTIPSTRYRRRLIVFKRTKELMAFLSGGKKDSKVIQAKGAIMRSMRVKEISSPANETFKTFIKILSGKGIKKNKTALISGPKQIDDILKDYPDKCLGWLISSKAEDLPENLPGHITIYRLHPELFQQLDMFGTKAPLLQARIEPFERWMDEQPWPEGCTLFLPCQDPENVGAIIRSAAAFGVTRVVVLKEAANPFLPKSTRVAGSTLFRIPILEGPSIHELQSKRVSLIGLSPEGQDVAGFQFPGTFGLIPGLEGQGLPETLRKGTILSIPTSEKVESLNTAAATAIVLYAWKRQTV